MESEKIVEKSMAHECLERCTEEQLKKIYGELNVTEDSLDRDVKYLEEWLKKEEHLPNVKDENFLKMFLLRCKNSLERTKRSLDVYFTARYLLPELYTNMDPYSEKIRKTMKTAFPAITDNKWRELVWWREPVHLPYEPNIFFKIPLRFYSWTVPLPKLTSAGDRIHFFRIFDPKEADNMSIDDYSLINPMNFDSFIQMSDKFRKQILICDYENLSLIYSTTIMASVRKFIARNIDANIAYPTRIHKIILLNLHPMFYHPLTLAKRFLSKKIVNRIEISDTASLMKFDFLSADILPSDYGGKLKSLEELRDDWYESIRTLREWFIHQENLKADLTKKPAHNRYTNINDTLDIDGSFRQLPID